MPDNTRTDELYHHGIKGMKWGVRRYQNKDGSLTARGQKRYSDKSPYEVKTIDGDTFRVSRGSHKNFNTNKSKVTKTWGEYLRESDNKKLQDQMNKQADRRSRKNEKNQFKKDVKDYSEAKRIIDFETNQYGDIRNVRNRGHEMLNRVRIEKGNQYADRILKSSERRDKATTVGLLAGSAAAVVGLSYLAAKYDL